MRGAVALAAVAALAGSAITAIAKQDATVTPASAERIVERQVRRGLARPLARGLKAAPFAVRSCGLRLCRFVVHGRAATCRGVAVIRRRAGFRLMWYARLRCY